MGLLGDAPPAPAPSEPLKKSSPTDLILPPGPTPLFGPGVVPGTWSDVCGFIKPPDSNERWKVRQTDQQSCHHEVWLHLDFVERRSGQSHCERHEGRLFLKERSAVPLQQTKVSHRRGYKRPFAIFKMGRPTAASSGSALPYNESNVLCFTPFYLSVQQDHQHLT